MKILLAIFFFLTTLLGTFSDISTIEDLLDHVISGTLGKLTFSTNF